MVIIVIGGGPGGYVAALRAAHKGAQVTVVEKESVGGTCLHQGCIPTKALLEAAQLLARLRSPALGLQVTGASLNLPRLAKRKQEVIARLEAGIHSLLRRAKVKVIKGQASLLDQHRVRVGEEVLTGDALILATGSISVKPPAFAHALDSQAVLSLESLPQSAVVIGGGMIGLELAQFWHLAGSKVILIEALPQLLPGEDREMAQLLEAALRQEGIEIRLGTPVQKAGKDKVFLAQEELRAEVVMAALGRKPNIQGLGLEAIGLPGDRIKVDSRMETQVSGVYAVGDVTGGPMLAHAAMAGGRWAADNATGGHSIANFNLVPRCLYTQPQWAAVGLTEEQAREKYGPIKVGRFPFSANSRAQVLGETAGMVKVVAEPRYGQIVGVHILGPQASELIGQAIVAMKLEATIEDWPFMAHPTLSEALSEAVWDLSGEAIHK